MGADCSTGLVNKTVTPDKVGSVMSCLVLHFSTNQLLCCVQHLQNLVRALHQQILCGLDTQRLSFTSMAANLGTQDTCTVIGTHQTTQIKLIALQLRKTGNGYLAATIKAFVQRTFGDNPVSGILIMQGIEQVQNTLVAFAAFNANCSLTTCW